jgi:hypothetical protein
MKGAPKWIQGNAEHGALFCRTLAAAVVENLGGAVIISQKQRPDGDVRLKRVVKIAQGAKTETFPGA